MTPKFREIKPNKITDELLRECNTGWCKPDKDGLTKMAVWSELNSPNDYCQECRQRRENETNTIS